MAGGVEYGLAHDVNPVLLHVGIKCGEGAGRRRGPEEARCSVSLAPVTATRLPLECSLLVSNSTSLSLLLV